MRGKSVVWDHFKCDDEEGHASSPTGGKCRPAAYCSYCNLKYTFPNATKMMRHLLKCTLCPADTKKELEQSGFGEYRIDHNGTSMNSTHDDDIHPNSSMVRRMISPVFVENESPTPGTSAMSPSFLVVPNPLPRNNDQQEARAGRISGDSNRMEDVENVSPVNRALARAMFSTDVPIDIIQNSHWQEVFRHLQPSYTLPTKETLMGRLLDDEYMVTLDRVSTELNKATFAGVLAHSHISDSKTVTNHDRLINLVITTPRPVFVGCMEPVQQQNPSLIADVISSVIAKASAANVLLVITNLSTNFLAAWSILKLDFPLISFAGCPTEELLTIPNIILAQETMRNMTKRAFKVCEVWNRLVPNDDTQNHILLPGSGTDEYVVRNIKDVMYTIEKLNAYKEKLQERIMTKAESVDADTKDIIRNKEFWDNVHLSVKVWRTIHRAVSRLESDASWLSDVVVEIAKVDNFLLDAVGKSCFDLNEREAILKRSHEVKTSCWTDLHYAACLVDPRYCGKSLPEGAVDPAIEYIVGLAKHLGQDVGRVLANLAEFRAKEGRLWSQGYVWEAATHVAPATWWKGICDRQPLSRIASGILSLAVASPMMKVVSHRRTENLSPDQAKKMVFIRANSDSISSNNHQSDMILVRGGY